jgi:hypothetical protein
VIGAAVVGGVFLFWQLRSRGRGVDHISTMDARMEVASYRGSFLGAVSKGHMGTVRTIASIRWTGICGAAVYLAGAWARMKTGI